MLHYVVYTKGTRNGNCVPPTLNSDVFNYKKASYKSDFYKTDIYTARL